MKELKKLLLSALVVVVVGVGALSLIDEEIRDRFNPFIKEKDVYALVNEEGKFDQNRYMFLVDGVDESGEVEAIKVTASVKSFPENSYWKVRVKGKYVYEYENIKEAEIPERVKEILEK
jgi:uncharacterized protein (TIGR01655 family)